MKIRAGINQFYAKDCPIEMMYTPAKGVLAQRPGTLLVSFKAAIPARERKVGPFFSGRLIADMLGLPLLSIADPVVSDSPTIGLAWYAGSERNRDLPNRIADILNKIAIESDCRLVLFGGSGAGFAVLSLLARLECSSTGLIWNPQTSISRYDPITVEKYLRSAFPSLADELDIACESSPPSQLALEKLLDKAQIDHDKTSFSCTHNQSLVYLQNENDWHIHQHLVPFTARGDWQRLGGRSFSCEERGVAVWVGDWGKGHIEPPLECILECIEKLGKGVPVEAVAREMDDSRSTASTPLACFKTDGRDGMVNATIHVKAGHATILLDVDKTRCVGANYQYAFYYLVDGKRISVQWYSDLAQAKFLIPDDGVNHQVIAFVRDGIGDVISHSIPLSPSLRKA